MLTGHKHKIYDIIYTHMGNKGSPLKDVMKTVNNSKLFAGMIMIMLNICSKHISINLSKSQEAYLSGGMARQLLIVSIIWMGTKDVITSLILTAVFKILSEHLFHEESKYCILPNKMRTYSSNEPSDEQIKHAQYILRLAEEQDKL
jgi:hypothetical protein